MALRKLVYDGDSILLKKSRPVTAFDARLHTLLDDLRDTLIEAEGAGLAAPQVGVLRRAAIVLLPDGEFAELINPEIIASDNIEEGAEGCLSFPNIWGVVPRPLHATVRAQNRHGEFFELSGEGITARALCHEIDHLNGVVFTSLVTRFIDADEVIAMRGGGEDE